MAAPIPSVGVTSVRAGRDDEIFFKKKGVPYSAKVLATGAHGCTVMHEGAHCRVRWENVSGHKKRADERYTVVEHGDDGLIVKNQRGERRLVLIPREARMDNPQVK